MPVTLSTAADRQRRASSPAAGGAFRMPGMPGMSGGSDRTLETVLLAAAALVVFLGVIMVYLATVNPLAGFEQRLTSGEAVDLNSLRGADQLLPVLDAFDSSAARSFVGQ